MSNNDITACIPSASGTLSVVSTIFAVLSQERRPNRVILLDTSEAGLTNLPGFNRLFDYFRFDFIRVPPGMGCNQARHRLLTEANSDWVWFVDDDMLPYYTCLRYLADQRERGINGIGGCKLDVVRKDQWQPEWNAGVVMRPWIQEVPWLDAANMLVRRGAMLSAYDLFPEDFPRDASGGDVLLTALIRNCILESRAVAFHVPTGEPRWSETETNDQRVLDALRPMLPPEEYQRLLRSRNPKG